MADNVNLDARAREGRGKNDARRLRAQGMVPAVLYGDADGNSVLAVPEKIVDYTLQHVGDNALYDLSIGSGGNATARVVDAQRNPVTGRLVHVDFAPVNMRERIVVTVPVAVIGESPGVSEGGVLQQEAYEVEVETLPGDIPQELEVDVSGLDINENLSIGDIRLPEGITLISDPEEVAVTVTTPTEVTEDELEAAGIVEEPSEDDTAEGVEPDAEEGTEEVSPEEGEGPAGQNVQA
ncbi:50S ribosomal protein L25 [Rubrobacter marinus]|uniref:Large ribosomal subunit protein bL25 n=1 Tax=Rubrobacter marinus TaxID=2653852 RepID=A0A6G8PYY3_9ACTN|nr:50S ribosomal protein L25 [Rubrobacter marinus]QIN79402.1 50S ribosomal protein L25 [Rubrobacter marinus]